MKKNQVTTNDEQGVFVIPTSGGYTCLGYEVCERRTMALANEMKVQVKAVSKGTIEAYEEYLRMCEMASDRNAATGWRSESELIPEFIGNEGRKVRVVTSYGETMTYTIGKSTGYIPCHLMIMRSNAMGGGAVVGHPFKSIEFLTSKQ